MCSAKAKLNRERIADVTMHRKGTKLRVCLCENYHISHLIHSRNRQRKVHPTFRTFALLRIPRRGFAQDRVPSYSTSRTTTRREVFPDHRIQIAALNGTGHSDKAHCESLLPLAGSDDGCGRSTADAIAAWDSFCINCPKRARRLDRRTAGIAGRL